MMSMQRCEGYIFRMCLERNDYGRLFISDSCGIVDAQNLAAKTQICTFAEKGCSSQVIFGSALKHYCKDMCTKMCPGKYLFWQISVLANICSGCSSERLMQFVEKEQKLVEGQWEPFHRWAFVKRCKLKTIPKTTPPRLGRQMQIIGVHAVLYCVLVLDFKDRNEEELTERWFW